MTPKAQPTSPPSSHDNDKTSEVSVSRRKPEAPSTFHHDADAQTASPRLRGRKLTAALAFVAGTGFTLFGCVFTTELSLAPHSARSRYDQGVMSALLTAGQVRQLGPFSPASFVLKTTSSKKSFRKWSSDQAIQTMLLCKVLWSQFM
jgi:hypothetical protein